jgi:hypothetical protein
MSLSIGKKGWVGAGGGGAGSITGGQNLGAGAEVFAGLSGALSEIMDFRTITGSDGIIVTQSTDEIDISGSGIVGGAIPAVQSFVEGTGDNPNMTVINETFYAGVVPWGDGVINAVQIWVEVLGGSPSLYDIAMYNDAGVLIGGKITPAGPNAIGSYYITFDSDIALVRNKKFWVAIAGSATGNTQINGDNSSTNSTSWNRTVGSQPTIPAGNLPAGSLTARRVWFRLVKI